MLERYLEIFDYTIGVLLPKPGCPLLEVLEEGLLSVFIAGIAMSDCQKGSLNGWVFDFASSIWKDRDPKMKRTPDDSMFVKWLISVIVSVETVFPVENLS